MELTELKDILSINGIYTFLYQEKKPGFLFPGEIHDFWELIYMTKGYAYLLIEDKGYKISEGELFFFNKNQNHILWSDDTVSPCFLTISFDMTFHDCSFYEFKRFRVDERAAKLFKILLDERIKAYEGDIYNNIGPLIEKTGNISAQLMKLHLTELILNLYLKNKSQNKKNLSSFSKTATVKSENMIISKCKKYIEKNLEEKLYLENISGNIPVSPSYLNRLFRKHENLSVIEYSNLMKMNKAKDLIKGSMMTITLISEKLGFSSLHYFSRLFKKTFGISPREYLKSSRSYYDLTK